MSKDRQPVRKPRWSLFIAALPAMVFGAIAAAFLWGLFNNDDGLPSTMTGSVPTALAGLRLTGAFTACRKPL